MNEMGAKHLRESKFGLERVQTKPMAVRLFIDATSIVHLTIGFMIAHTSKQLWKCLKGKAQL